MHLIFYSCLCITRPPEPVYSTVNKLCDKPPSPRHYSPVECDKSFLLSAPYPHYHVGLLSDSEITRYCMRFFLTSFVRVHEHHWIYLIVCIFTIDLIFYSLCLFLTMLSHLHQWEIHATLVYNFGHPKSSDELRQCFDPLEWCSKIGYIICATLCNWIQCLFLFEYGKRPRLHWKL